MEFLLPHHLFESMGTGWLILVGIVSLVALAKGADWLVEGAVAISLRLGTPKMIVGATVVSLGTTMPEAAVSVMAAWRGMPDLALGNSVGSIICDTGLIFGLACMLTRLPADKFVLNRHGWIQIGSGALLVVLSLLFRDDEGNRILPRGVGFFLIGLLAIYLFMSLRWAKSVNATQSLEDLDEIAKVNLSAAWAKLGGGITIVIFSSHVLIQCVRIVCERLGVPPAIVAATLIAFGTSLPELVTAISCLIKGQTELLVGNILGADILNVLFVTGAAACAAPLIVEPIFLKLHFPVMMLCLVIFRLNASFSKGGTFARWPGAVLLAGYLGYLIFSVMML